MVSISITWMFTKPIMARFFRILHQAASFATQNRLQIQGQRGPYSQPRPPAPTTRILRLRMYSFFCSVNSASSLRGSKGQRASVALQRARANSPVSIVEIGRVAERAARA